ncbi:MAG: hypothetical protein ACQESG_01475 [Nanobdellota archaeon]
MVQNQLVMYIQSLVNQGYQYTDIRTYLINSGWPPGYVDQAMQYVQFPQPVSRGIPKVFLVLGGVVVILIAAVPFLFISDSLEQLLDYRVKVLEKRLEKQDDLIFSNTLTNMGTASRYDVFLMYSIKDLETGEVVDTWKESKAVTTVAEFETRRSISSLHEGKYELDVMITYGGGNATASDTFRVVTTESCTDGVMNQDETGIDCGGVCSPCDKCKDGIRNQGEVGIDCGGPCDPCKETCSDSVKNQDEVGVDCGGSCPPCKDTCGDCDDDLACTKDICIEGECYHKDIVPCCGNGVCEDGETPKTCSLDCKSEELTSREISQRVGELDDQDEAGEFCNSIDNSYKRDFCFRSLAHDTGNKHFCSYVESISVSDFCYLKFGTNGDAEACTHIQNRHMKTSCESLND